MQTTTAPPTTMQDGMPQQGVNPDWLLMKYAAGALRPYESLIVATYLAINPAARERLALYESACGDMMDSQESAPVTEACLEKVMGVICGTAPKAQPARPARVSVPPALRIPEPFSTLMHQYCPEQRLSWTQVSNGIMKIDIRLCHSEPRQRRLRLLRLAPHQRTVQHRHRGLEITLVLEGSFGDETGSYAAGDVVVINDPRLSHCPQAGEQGCLCLILTDAPLRYADPIVQLLSLFRRL